MSCGTDDSLNYWKSRSHLELACKVVTLLEQLDRQQDEIHRLSQRCSVCGHCERSTFEKQRFCEAKRPRPGFAGEDGLCDIPATESVRFQPRQEAKAGHINPCPDRMTYDAEGNVGIGTPEALDMTAPACADCDAGARNCPGGGDCAETSDGLEFQPLPQHGPFTAPVVGHVQRRPMEVTQEALPAAGPWQDGATAPKDGREIMAIFGGTLWLVVWEREAWEDVSTILSLPGQHNRFVVEPDYWAGIVWPEVPDA